MVEKRYAEGHTFREVVSQQQSLSSHWLRVMLGSPQGKAALAWLGQEGLSGNVFSTRLAWYSEFMKPSPCPV